MIDDIESTIRFTIDKDHLRQQVADAIKEAGQMAGDAFIDALRGGGGGRGGARGGGRTRSSADPDVTADVRGDTGGGAPSGAPASGGRRGGGGGNVKTPNDAQAELSGGGGGAASRPGPRPRDWEGRFRKAGEMDYMQYLAPLSLRRDAQYLASALGPEQGSAMRSAMGIGSHMAGDKLINAAKERAEYIEWQKEQMAQGVDAGPLASMGLLRYAHPIAAGLTVAGGMVAQHVSKGLSLQESHSKAYGNYAETLALAKQQFGAVGNPDDVGFGPASRGQESYLRRAAMAKYGGLSSEEGMRTLGAYLSIGYTRGRQHFDFLPLKGAGISDEAIAAYGSMGRLGASNADPTRLAAAMGNAGFSPNVSNMILQQIAENTRSVAMRGIKVDMDSSVAWMEKAIASGKSPDLAAAAYQNMTSVASSPLEQLMQAPRTIAEALSWQSVVSNPMSRGGELSGMIRAAGAVAADPSQVLMRTDPNTEWGRLAAIGMTGQLGMEGIAQRQRPGQQALAPLSGAFNAGEQYNPFDFRAASARRESWLWDTLQTSKAFSGQQYMAGESEIGAMRWDFLNEGKALIMDLMNGDFPAIGRMLQPINDSMREMVVLLTQILNRPK